MNDYIMKFDYKDTDTKENVEVELFGLRFIINEDAIMDLENIDTTDENAVLHKIDEILGTGAVNKINSKRLRDGYNIMDIKVQLNVMGCLSEAYVNHITNNITDRIENTSNRKINSSSYRRNRNNSFNRKQRY